MSDPHTLSSFTVQPLVGEDRFRLHFRSGDGGTQFVAVFETDRNGLGALIATLQDFQAKYKIQIPPSLRAKKGPPSLTIVKDE